MTFIATSAVVDGIQNHLPDNMSDVWVASKIPLDRPKRCLRITRIGGRNQGNFQGVTDRVRCLFEYWDEDEIKTELGANIIHDLVLTLAGKWVTALSLEGSVSVFVRWAHCDTRPVPFDDELGRSRFQFQGYLDLSLT